MSGNSSERSSFAMTGAPWAEDDYLEFVAAIRSGLSDEALAAKLGRSVGALRARAQKMLNPTPDRAHALQALREVLETDADFDWRRPVRAAAAAGGYHFWTRADEDILARGWVDRRPMSDLIFELGVPERTIVRQLLGLRLATSVNEIVDRIGCQPAGDLALRRALAADKQSAAVWCLVVTFETHSPHISVHPTEAAATVARDAVFAHLEQDRALSWWIAKRVAGDGATGSTSSGSDQQA